LVPEICEKHCRYRTFVLLDFSFFEDAGLATGRTSDLQKQAAAIFTGSLFKSQSDLNCFPANT